MYKQPGYDYRFVSRYSQAASTAPVVPAEPPKEDAKTYFGHEINGERVISPGFQKIPSPLPQLPPIIFKYRDQVGVPVSNLLLHRYFPIHGQGVPPFNLSQHGTHATIKGNNMLTGESKSVRFALTRRSQNNTIAKDYLELAFFVVESFLPVDFKSDVNADLRAAVKGVTLWETGKKDINPYYDLILVALEHSPSEFAWRPVFFHRQG
ncbi:hypothetical protein BDY19DRAFT_526328 [Irpex rosettiformis]|uniref:Uncharacterized protein n=1 Tax=Irpex rosettiformis TaxID=378272 RepID=A0ACB8TR67_9APHY|nr:hypothetical protein BDY19DRAFT_526328 [Irpex rosettiformis]